MDLRDTGRCIEAQLTMTITWTQETEPALMRASQPARLGPEKPHEWQAPRAWADPETVAR